MYDSEETLKILLQAGIVWFRNPGRRGVTLVATPQCRCHSKISCAMVKASQALVRRRYLLPEGAEEWVAAAEQSDVLK